jgi:ABC-type arginine transport system ATPase subunit
MPVTPITPRKMSIDQSNVFEERAENLSKDELSDWTTLTAKDRLNIRKLKGAGAKLLIGPRGCGKSTLMRVAYFEVLSERSAFPIYVNYSRSMALEPLFHSNANAVLIFRQWVLCKIAREALASAAELKISLPKELARIANQADRVIVGLERGEVPSDHDLLISPSQLVEWLEQICFDLDVPRAVLLLDDAAHAFSGEQQTEFFEIFRQLRTKSIAPKAAVYPGITSYSPNFHIGHEAEELNAWYDVSDPQYLEGMKSLVARRFSSDIVRRLEGRDEQIELLALVAFGIPRGFLNMLSALLDQQSTKAGWAETRPVIEAHAESVRKIFKSLTVRLPKFRHFVEVGLDLDRAFIEHIRRYNIAHIDAGTKTTVVGIEEPLASNLERVLHMMEYSGVVRDEGTQSRGSKGSYRKFMIHHALVARETLINSARILHT